MIALLDADVLIALTDGDHVHHDTGESRLTSWQGPFATCPTTQGALVRSLLRSGSTASAATTVVRDPRGVVGHRQVSDAHLAALARARGARLATLDRALAALHADVTVLVGAEW